MEAPDKIYIQPNAHDRWFDGNKPNDNFVEYIRKDALLEWAKEHKRVIETRGDERDAYLRGEYSALNSLIDKLKSM